MSTDWGWCYENPREAAAEIDRLRLTDELRRREMTATALAHLAEADTMFEDEGLPA